MSCPTSEPPGLTPDERDAWARMVGLMIRLPSALDSQLQRDSGLNSYDYLALARLSESPCRTLRMSDLAGLTNGSLSRLSHVISKLEKRGWVERAACPEDGRYTNAILTDAGAAKLAEAAPGHIRHVRELVLDALSPEQLAALRDIGATVLARISDGCTAAR